jgi:hypothetical protein
MNFVETRMFADLVVPEAQHEITGEVEIAPRPRCIGAGCQPSSGAEFDYANLPFAACGNRRENRTSRWLCSMLDRPNTLSATEAVLQSKHSRQLARALLVQPSLRIVDAQVRIHWFHP